MVEEVNAREQWLRGAETVARQREAHFRSLLENVTDIIMKLDAEGMVLYASPSLQRVLDFDFANWNSRNLCDIVLAEAVLADVALVDVALVDVALVETPMFSACCALGSPQTLRAYSSMACWKPPQVPRKGIPPSRAALTAASTSAALP